MNSMEEHVDVVVVGAGWNGLISAKTYLDFSPSANLIILDEQATIGGVWSTEKIYPSLFAQMKHGLFEYSSYPMRHEGISEDGYISGQAIHTYLNDFASDHDLVRRIRLQTTVTNVSRITTGSGGWILEIEGNKRPPIKCMKLIYASGATSHPIIPSWPTTDFESPIIHSAETGTHLDALRNVNSATVIGGAKSSYDTVFLLLKEGKKVDWIIREDGSGPLALMPPTIMGMANTGDVVTTRLMAMMGASMMSTDGAGHQFFQRNLLGRYIAKSFWRFTDFLAANHAGYSKSANAEKLRPLPHGNAIFWAHAGLGAASVPFFWKTFHAGDCTVHRTDIESLSDKNTVNLKDGTSFKTDYIVLCTGFDKSYQVFSESLQQQLGLVSNPTHQAKWTKLESSVEEEIDELLPVLKDSPFDSTKIDHSGVVGGKKLLHGPSRHYRRLIVPELATQGDRSIIFPGFIHTIYTPVVSEVQALWGVAFLLGLNEPPTQSEMDEEIAEWAVWSRKRYVSQGAKHAYAIFDFLPYIDTLFKDLGLNPRREKSFFKNWFLPTYPSLYKGMVDEFKRALGEKRGLKAESTPGSATPETSDESIDLESCFHARS